MTRLLILWGLLAHCVIGCSRSDVEAPRQSLALEQATPRLVTAEDLDPRPDQVRVELVARALEEGHDGLLYAYNGLNPGPVIRAKLGDTVTVAFRNELDAATTIHWHGVKVPFEMDGVAWRGAPIQPGESFDYVFTLTQTGTFWYHPHFNTDRQVDGGLYGALIVEDPADPVPDAEWVLIFDTAHEFDPERHALPDGLDGRPGHGHGRRQAMWLVNGEPAPVTMRPRGGERVRVRMINVSSSGYLDLSWDDMRQIAGDQGLLPAPHQPERIVMGPGDRADVEVLVGRDDFVINNGAWSLNGGPSYEPSRPLIHVEVDTPTDPPTPAAYPFPGGQVSPDPPYTDILYVFSGSDRTGVWLINGERFPDVTVHTLDYGAQAIIEIRNLSPTEHPFHLHGLEFEVLSVNGRAPAYRTVEDTYNLRIRDQLRIKVLADNPGYWMTHCHILPHAADGMMTVLEVRDP